MKLINFKFVIISLFFTLFTYSQSKTKALELLKDNFHSLLYCYKGENEKGKMNIIDIENSRLESIKRINNVLGRKIGPDFLDTYPIYFHLINHINSSLTTISPKEACNELAKAIISKRKLDTTYVINIGTKTSIINAYKKIGVDLDSINNFYDSKYCVRFDIFEGNCMKKNEEPITLEKGKKLLKIIKNNFIHKKLKINNVNKAQKAKKDLEKYLFLNNNESERKKTINKINILGSQNNNKEDSPVYFHFIEALNAAIQNHTTQSCELLEKTKTEYNEIDSIFPFIMAEAKKRQYQEIFNINLVEIEKLTASRCSKTVNPPITPNPAITIPEEPEIAKKTKYELLKIAVAKGMVKNSLFSLDIAIDKEHLPITDSLFLITIGDPKIKETIYFKPASYTIRNNQSIASEKAFENFKNTIKLLAGFITKISERYQIDAYQVFIQGSADSPTFLPKKVISPRGIDINTFKNIEVTVMNPKNKNLPIEIYQVGNTYINKDLPNLRAAYVKNILLMFSDFVKHPEKISLFDGFVKEYVNDKKRNVVLYFKIKESVYKKNE